MSTSQKMQSTVRKSTAARKPAPARKAAVVTKQHADKPAKAVADSLVRSTTEVPIPARNVATDQSFKVATDAKPVKAKAKAKPVGAKTEAAKPAKEARHKHKLVRDSFTMPREDFDLIHALKERAIGFKRPTKKSELLRAGLQVLATLDDTALRLRLESLLTLSPGRPKKHR